MVTLGKSWVGPPWPGPGRFFRGPLAHFWPGSVIVNWSGPKISGPSRWPTGQNGPSKMLENISFHENILLKTT